MRRLLTLMISSMPGFASSQEVGAQQLIRQLSQQQGFEISGVEHLGNSSIVVTDGNEETEQLLNRALRHYNHVVRYADGEVSAVVIFGKKGNDVGFIPQTHPDADPVEEN